MKAALPQGNKPAEDETIVSQLVVDELFKESIESEYGKITKIYPDWRTDKLVYEFLDGSSKYSVLSEIVKALKDLKYLESSLH